MMSQLSNHMKVSVHAKHPYISSFFFSKEDYIRTITASRKLISIILKVHGKRLIRNSSV